METGDTLRNFTEHHKRNKYSEKKKKGMNSPLSTEFVGFEKTFESIVSESLWKLLRL